MRALYPAAIEALRSMEQLTEENLRDLELFVRPQLRNWQGTVIGFIEPITIR
jgi:hypothetical protein